LQDGVAIAFAFASAVCSDRSNAAGIQVAAARACTRNSLCSAASEAALNGRAFVDLRQNEDTDGVQRMSEFKSFSPTSLVVKKNTCMWYGVMVNYITIDIRAGAA
jgi:hypothetical protein